MLVSKGVMINGGNEGHPCSPSLVAAPVLSPSAEHKDEGSAGLKILSKTSSVQTSISQNPDLHKSFCNPVNYAFDLSYIIFN